MSLELEKRKAETAELEANKADISFGSQIRSYVLAPYQLVKDTRTKLERGNVDAVLAGDIDDFIKAFLLARKAAWIDTDYRRLHGHSTHRTKATSDHASRRSS